jgi:hypothetical protein
MVIVVAESDEARSGIGSALRDDGHEVIELRDGAELLARLISLVAGAGRRRESIAVVATPERSVLAVLRMLGSAQWPTPVVLVADEDVPSGDADVRTVARFARPLDMGALRATVWRTVPPRSREAAAQ